MKVKLSLFLVVLLIFCLFLAKPVYAEGIPSVAPQVEFTILTAIFQKTW